MATAATGRRADGIMPRIADGVYNPGMAKKIYSVVILPDVHRDARVAAVPPCCAAPDLVAAIIANNTTAALRRAEAMTEKFGVVPARQLSSRQWRNLATCGNTRRARSGAEQVRRNAEEWKRRGW